MVFLDQDSTSARCKALGNGLHIATGFAPVQFGTLLVVLNHNAPSNRRQKNHITFVGEDASHLAAKKYNILY